MDTAFQDKFEKVKRLYPRKPKCPLHKEDKTVARVHLCNKVYRNLKAIPMFWNTKDGKREKIDFLVYKAFNIRPSALYSPSPFLVPDVSQTKEIWSLTSIDVKYIGTISVYDSEGKCWYEEYKGEKVWVDTRVNIKWKWLIEPTEKVWV